MTPENNNVEPEKNFDPNVMTKAGQGYFHRNSTIGALLMHVHSQIALHKPEPFNWMGQHESLLVSIVFCRLVDNFSMYLTELFLEVGNSNPLIFLSIDAPVSVGEILKIGGEAAVQNLLEKKIAGLSYKSFEDQRKELKNRLNFELLSDTEALDVTELIAIRNLFVHNNGVVNSVFLEKCPWRKEALGDKIFVDFKWMMGAHERLFKYIFQIDYQAVKKWKLDSYTLVDAIKEFHNATSNQRDQ
ncbi:MAG TPA: hypothetical protein V6C86_05750 [Oculatellaceae cyanobacterium]